MLEIADAGGGLVGWKIRVFERTAEGAYRLHEETIREIGFPPERIREALAARFRRVRALDRQRSRPSPRSGRLWFVCRGPHAAAGP